MSRLSGLWLFCLVPLLALNGCATHKDSSRVTTSPGTVTISDGVVTRPAATRARETRHHNAATAADSRAAAALPEHTGIPACDDYLSSYLACHRAANIFPGDQLQSHYEAMRTTLLRDSQDPKTRTFQTNRCNALASALHDALHGKSCDATPAAASTTP